MIRSVVLIYRALFGWWLDPVLLRSADRALGRQINRSMQQLFRRRDAHVVANSAMEYGPGREKSTAVATVIAPDLKLQFVRQRNDLILYGAPANGKRGWSLLPSEFYDSGQPYSAWSDQNLSAMADALNLHWKEMAGYVNQDDELKRQQA